MTTPMPGIRKLGLLFSVSGVLSFLTSIYIDDIINNKITGDYTKLVIVPASIILFFLGISLYWFPSEDQIRKKVKRIYLALSISGMALGLFFKITSQWGAAVFFIIGSFSFCFAFLPLEFKDKIKKWIDHSDNKLITILLSTIDFIAIILVIFGAVFRFQRWEGSPLVAISAIVFVFIALFVWNWRFRIEVVQRKRSEEKIRLQNQELEMEKERSEKLLLNILPAEIAEELKHTGQAEAKQFENVSILFSDFKDFTQKSSLMSPTDLVKELNYYFKAFDLIMDQFGIEKIKTIGDAYMAAGGVPQISHDSATQTVLAALAMQEVAIQRKTERESMGLPYFDMRIGIHTGPIVAGVVGTKKFQYDIWGDTVNIASRMESAGEIHKVNISEHTFQLIQKNSSFSFTPRGEIEAKGKGKLKMYFVEKASNSSKIS